jgi:hypothetical protein
VASDFSRTVFVASGFSRTVGGGGFVAKRVIFMLAAAVDQTTTIVAADGKLTREEWKVDPAAPIDCF